MALKISIILLFGTSLLFLSCKKELLSVPVHLEPEVGEAFSGGSHTTFNTSSNAFGLPIISLNAIDNAYFAAGNSLFKEAWVTAPSSTTARDGLGPFFNANACAACHFKDGRGRPPLPGETSTGLLLRIGQNSFDPSVSGIPDSHYGDQLQDRSIMGLNEEYTYSIIHNPLNGTYPDGTPYSLSSPTYQLSGFNYSIPDAGYQISPRIGSQLIGLGLLEAIPASTILEYADEFDSDGNGISGKPNYALNVETGMPELGRFGWKSNMPNLMQQIAGAFNGDMGITSSMFPNENYTTFQAPTAGVFQNGGNPEIEDLNLYKVYLYMSSLQVPGRRNYDDKRILEGKQIFRSIGCADCHRPKYETGTHADFSYLKNQVIWPYSDLLLHDMGDSLADGKTDYAASGKEWRTPPLWGIGLLPTVNGHQFLLHDGRANGVEEAILWHGGEGTKSRNQFMSLSSGDRQKLIDFINSL